MVMTDVDIRSLSQCQGWLYRLGTSLLLILTIGLFSYTLVCIQAAEASELHCNDGNVIVRAPNAADGTSVCQGAADAIRFLAAQGLKTSGHIEVLVVDTLPYSTSSSTYGGYVHSELRAYLLRSSKIAERRTVFNLPFERGLYQSLAAHEVAHAIAASNFRVPNPQIEAEEYIAYVTMYATMPERYRNALFEQFRGERFENEIQINTFSYLLDPFRFGILAYKHFMKLDNKGDFLQRVLAGRALLEFAY